MAKKIIVIACLTFFAFVLAWPLISRASEQIFFTPQVGIPDSQYQQGRPTAIPTDTGLICQYIIAVYKYGIGVVGIMAVLAIAIGGVMIVVSGTSMVVGGQKKASEGRAWITAGLSGLVLALGAFLLLSTINKDLITCRLHSLDIIPKVNAPTKTEFSNSMPVPEKMVCISNIAENDQDVSCDDFPGWVENPFSSCGDLEAFKLHPKSKCCCPDPKLAAANFCQTADEGDTCTIGDQWGYCENKRCRACRQPTDVFSGSPKKITRTQLNAIPEKNKCYRNSKNYECQAPIGICGNNGNGDCNMYKWDEKTGYIKSWMGSIFDACNQGNIYCVCELGF